MQVWRRPHELFVLQEEFLHNSTVSFILFKMCFFSRRCNIAQQFLWAVAPEGQAESLVELPIGENFNVDATTKLQTFGLMITAEPHQRVALPSPVIVAENALRRGTEGSVGVSQIEYSGDAGTLYVS